MDSRTTTLTSGNIRNNHMYLSDVEGFFPSDALGGGRAAEKGADLLIDWGGPEPAFTDIDTNKMIFRKRGWVRQFFDAQRVVPGDSVRIERITERQYRVSVVRRPAPQPRSLNAPTRSHSPSSSAQRHHD